MKGYISVSEFARRAGVSRQAVYNALNNRLVNFTKKDSNGRTLVMEGAVVVFKHPELSRDCKQEVDKTVNEVDIEGTAAALKEQIEYLKAEIEKRDSTIKEKDLLLAEQAQKILNLAEQAQILATQAQQLHAADKKALLTEKKKTRGFLFFHARNRHEEE